MGVWPLCAINKCNYAHLCSLFMCWTSNSIVCLIGILGMSKSASNGSRSALPFRFPFWFRFLPFTFLAFRTPRTPLSPMCGLAILLLRAKSNLPRIRHVSPWAALVLYIVMYMSCWTTDGTFSCLPLWVNSFFSNLSRRELISSDHLKSLKKHLAVLRPDKDIQKGGLYGMGTGWGDAFVSKSKPGDGDEWHLWTLNPKPSRYVKFRFSTLCRSNHSLPEWSKGVDSSTRANLVGSNPTVVAWRGSWHEKHVCNWGDKMLQREQMARWCNGQRSKLWIWQWRFKSAPDLY